MGYSLYRLLTRSEVVVNPGSDFIELRLALWVPAPAVKNYETWSLSKMAT